MKKICMAAYTHYLADPRPRREAETLARRGDQVDFISLAETGSPPIEIVKDVRVFRVPQGRYRGRSELSYILAYLTFFMRVTIKVFRLFLRERYDIIYLHTMPDFIVFVALLPKLFGAKVVLNIHDMMPELYMSKFGISERHLLIRFLKLQERLSIAFANKVICVHHPHREVVARRSGAREKITILLNVPDPHWFSKAPTPGATNPTFRIVYHGTVTKRLGTDIAVRAFAKARRSCPDARLEIYGNGDFGEELQALIKNMGLEHAIYFSKKVFRIEELSKMLNGAALGIIPNRRDVATEYMLPVKLLEYVYLGIPAVAPRLTAIQHYFQDNQIAYYDAEDVDGLAATICRLYNSVQERAELKRNAPAFFEKYSWDVMREDLFKVVDCW